jgi:hypothetical protein
MQLLLSEGEADAFHEASNGRNATMEAARGGHTGKDTHSLHRAIVFVLKPASAMLLGNHFVARL